MIKRNVKCIPKRLKELREASHTSREMAADIAGVSLQSYIDYERGNTGPSVDVLVNLAEYFDVSVDYLLGRDPSYMLNMDLYRKSFADCRCEAYRYYLRDIRGKGIPRMNVKSIPDFHIKSIWPYNLLNVLFGKKEDTVWEPLTKDQEYGLYTALATLDERDQHVLQLTFHYGYTLRECSSILSLSFERIRQIQKRAVERLRSPAALEYIRLGYAGRKIEKKRRSVREKRRKLAKEVAELRAFCEAKKEPPELVIRQYPDWDIEQLGLSARSYNGLRRAELLCVSDIIQAFEDGSIRKAPNLGQKSLLEIVSVVKETADVDLFETLSDTLRTKYKATKEG